MKTFKTLAFICFSLSVLSSAASAASTAQLPTSLFNKIKIGDIHGPVVGPHGPKVRVVIQR
ncbi:MAG: hypothetical protein HC855_02380 [Rhizobiales bacterium]|nr:hypothetical protein [Hyphomicrobiales bacterium]